MSWLVVILGALIGAPLRYLTDRMIHSRSGTVFPLGTLAVNAAGCLILGLVAGAVRAGVASPGVQLLVGTGFCGALTSYSTFSHQTLRLAETGAPLLAVANVAVGVTVGLVAAFAGVGLAHVVWP